MPSWQKSFSHFHGLLCYRSYLLGVFRITAFPRCCQLILRVVNLDLSLSHVGILRLALVLALLHEIIGIQLFSNFDTQLQVFTNEVLKLPGSGLLTLFLILNIVVMLHDLFDGLPVHAYHLTHVVSLTTNLYLFLSGLLLLVDLTVLKGLPDQPSGLLGVILLLLALTLEVLRHPDHFLIKEISVYFGCWL